MILTAEMLEEIEAWDTVINGFRRRWPKGVKVTLDLIKSFHSETNTIDMSASFLEELVKPSSYKIYRDLKIQARHSMKRQAIELEEKYFNEELGFREMNDELSDAWDRYDEDFMVALVTALNYQDSIDSQASSNDV